MRSPTTRPATTPDGNATAPYTVTSACRGMYTLDRASGAATAISGAPRAAFGPQFAPDGASVAWAESSSRVLFVRGDMTVRTAAPTGANSVPSWSPDSRRLLWSRVTSEGSEAVVTDADRGTEYVVPNTVRMRTIFAASPTGDHIAYGGGDHAGIRVARTDGTSDVEVPGAPETRNPVWSPTGSTLAFDDGNGVSTYDLATKAVDKLFTGAVDAGFAFAGDDRLLVATTAGIRVVDRRDGAVVATINGHGKPVWDAARDRVIFRRPAHQKYGSIIEATLDGSNERTLFVERDAQVLAVHPSPRGDTVAFHCQIVDSA